MDIGDEKTRKSSFQSSNESSDERGREIFLLLENPSKGNNLGPIIRCAAAFAIRKIVAVGYEKCSTEGAHGAGKHVEIVAFPTLDQAVSYLRGDCRCTSLIGLLGGAPGDHQEYELVVNEHLESSTVQVSLLPEERTGTPYPNSMPVQHVQPFSQGNCCLVVSKNMRGLPISLASCCDMFVHIPHVDVRSDGADSPRASLLDSQSCLSIALHYFAAFAECDERDFQGHKFKVVRQQQGVASRSLEDGRKAKAAARQEAKRLAAEEAKEAIDDSSLVNVFGMEPCGDY